MAEITRRRTGELLRKLFEILKASPEGMSAATALEQLANSVQLTDFELGNVASGKRRFETIVRFATVDCARAGWLAKHKGTWTVTEAGIEAYTRFTDPEAFYREAARLYRVWSKQRNASEKEIAEPAIEGDAESAERSSRITFEEAEEQAWGEIEVHIAAMDPYEFQDMVSDLLKAMGY